MAHIADRQPKAEEERAADDEYAQSDEHERSDVARHYREMSEIGADIKGKGEIT